MAIYTATLPNGQPYQVQGPEGASAEDIQAAAVQIYSQRNPAPYVDSGERNYSLAGAGSRAVSRGMERVKSTFGDVIPAMVGNALGAEQYAAEQMRQARASEELINRKYRAEFQSYKDVKGIGDALKFGIETIGEQLPNLGTMVGAGGIAGLGARVGTRKLAADALAKQGTAGVLAKRQAARTLAQRQATAQGVGIYMGSYSLNAPEIFQNIYQETGELTTGTAVLYGAVAAALDSVLPNAILKNITPIQKAAIAKAVLKKSGTRPGLAESVFKGFTKGAGSEALTEGAQEALSISAENFVAGNSQIFDSEDWERIMESSVRGAVAGGTFRGASEPFGRQPAERPEPIAPATEGQSDLIDSADAANIEIAMEAKKEAEESAKIEANIVKEEAKAVNEEVETQETLIDASAAEEAAAIESDQLAAVAAAKTSDQRLTKEEAAGFRGTLDAFDQMMFDVESEQLGGEENVLKNDDATGRAEVDRSGFEVPVGAADSVTGGIARDDGGEVEPSGSTLPAVGVGEGVVNPALTDQEKALKNKTARKYLPRINEAREKLRLLEEAELAKVSGDQAATYKLMAEQEARRKKAFMKINDEGMAEFEASRVETVTVEAATIPQDLIKDYKYLEVISEDPKLAVESNRIGASLLERMKGFLETIKQPATEENLAKLQARLNTEPVQESRADTEGTGQVYYRGTSEKFDNVAGTGGVIYFSPNREEAELVGGNIVTPYRLKVKNTFDINNKAHLKKVLAELSNEKPTFFKGRSYKNSQREIFKQALEDNPNFNFAPYEIIEEFAEEIEGAGFDSFFVNEQAGFAMGAKNIGVFDASLLEPIQESRTDTEGEFSVATELSPEIQQVLRKSFMGFESKMPSSQVRKLAFELEKMYAENGISFNGDAAYFMSFHVFDVVKNGGKITPITKTTKNTKGNVIVQNKQGIPIAAASVEVYPQGKRSKFPKRKISSVVTDPAVYIASVGSQNPQAMDALLEEAKRIARENNIRYVVMEDVTSEGAIKAFKRRGFVDGKKGFFEGEALSDPLSWRGQKKGELQKNVVDLEGAQESRADTEGTGQTTETVTAELVQEFGPNVIRMIESGKLVIVNSVDQLPANIKMSSTANGGYDAKTQTSYIIANRSQKGRARRILLHEIGEHHGLARMVGKDYIPLLNRLKTLRKQNAEVQAIFDEVQRLYPELTVDSTPFLQEVMAKLGERAPNNSLFRRIVGAVKNFLRRLGLYDVNKFSDADIQDMILNSLRVSLAEATSTSTRGQASNTAAVQMSKEELKTIAGWKPERITELIKQLNNNNMESNYVNRGTYYVATMSPQQFLDLAAQKLKGTEAKSIASLDSQIAEYFEGNSEAVLKWVNQNKDLYNPYNVPNLTFESPERQNAKITGHEGRHRARALQRLGVTQMPVLMIGPRRARAPDNTDTRFPKRVAVPNMAGKTFVKQDARNDFKENTVIENIISIEPKNETAIRELIDFNVNPEVSQDIQFSREEPPGGFNPTQYSKNFAMAESVMKKMPVGSADYMEGLWNKITQLPTTVRKIWMGMLGLQAMSDLYGKYLPSIKTLINVLERRAATVEATRAEVDVLGNLGMAIINPKGKKRKRIKYNEKTGAVEVDKNGDIVYTEETADRKYTPAELNRWEQTTYELSRDNIDPRNPDNRDDPLVKRFFNLPAELQALSIAYTTKYEQYGDQLIEAFTKNVGTDPKAKEEADRVVIEFKKNRLNFYHPFRRKGDYVLSYIPETELQRHYKALENIENMEAGLTAAGQKVSAEKKALLRAEEYKRHAIETQTPEI
jgi:hypothetical protein